MKNLKATDKVVLTIELTADEARTVRDSIYRTLAQHDENDGMRESNWMYPASVPYAQFLSDVVEDTIWLRGRPSLVKVYNALRESLRQPRKDDDYFVLRYDRPVKINRKAVFSKWFDSLMNCVATVPDMECERTELQSVLRAVKDHTGATLHKDGWHWRNKVYNCAELKAAMLEDYSYCLEAWEEF